MGESSIVIRRKQNFTSIANNAIRDKRVSLPARGLFAVMLSLPQDKPHTLNYISAIAGVGKETLRRYFGELERYGYLKREQKHGDHGKFAANEYLLDDFPAPPDADSPCTENPSTVKPDTEEPRTVQPCTENPSTKERTKRKNIPPISPQGEECALLFARFWKAYPKKRNRAAAERAWRKLNPSMELCHVMSAALERQKRGEDWQRDGGRYIPYPASWLNGRRWEDEDAARSDAGGDKWEEAFGVWR